MFCIYGVPGVILKSLCQPRSSFLVVRNKANRGTIGRAIISLMCACTCRMYGSLALFCVLFGFRLGLRLSGSIVCFLKFEPAYLSGVKYFLECLITLDFARLEHQSYRISDMSMLICSSLGKARSTRQKLVIRCLDMCWTGLIKACGESLLSITINSCIRYGRHIIQYMPLERKQRKNAHSDLLTIDMLRRG